jgi:DNA-directed RNA polymerase specialized sigma24 family protein
MDHLVLQYNERTRWFVTGAGDLALWQSSRMAVDREKLLRLALRLLISPSEAEDAVQESYVRALTAFPGEDEAGPAWMQTVLRNVAIDKMRRRRLESEYLQSALPDVESPDLESFVELESDCRDALRRMLERVSVTEPSKHAILPC